jgi:Amt family ammonium transporter
VAFIYPVVGMWHWGGGWLSSLGFHDFAGSTIVHGVGGWAALAGAWMLGPRLGRYSASGQGQVRSHSLPLAAIGALLLWFGWYGFNGGSVLSADPGPVSFVVVTTTLAAASGVVSAVAISWLWRGKPDLAMAINGALAGLVGITAGADVVAPMWAVLIGLVAGLLVFFATLAMNKARIDDPVGAVPVHLCCGIWGTLAVALVVPEVSMTTQLIGVMATGALCFPVSLLIFGALKQLVGLRVDMDHELTGLDLYEHGTEAYYGLGLGLSAETYRAIAAK